MSVPTTEPTELRAGLTWQWRREDLRERYPAGVWVLTYYYKKTGATAANFSVTASADGTAHLVNVPKGTTASRVPGDYTWVALVDNGTEQFEIDHGGLSLLPRYDQAVNLDDRSHARIVLDAIRAVLQKRATKDQEEYSIAGRTLKRTPLADLRQLERDYAARVADETAQAEGRPTGPLGRIRYGVPG